MASRMIAPMVATTMVHMNSPAAHAQEVLRYEPPNESTGYPDEDRDYDPAGIVARDD
jgi:hypothetical protein